MVKPKEGGISATWERDVKIIFCDICLQEIELGNRPTTHFNKEGWTNITKKFEEKTGREYDKSQLKNKWDQLKKDWKLWKELIRGSTGLGWDPKRKTIDASDEWWKEKLEVLPNAKKFKYCGIDPDLEDKLDLMFTSIVATGTQSWASNQIDEDVDTPIYSNEVRIDIDSAEDVLQNTEDVPECSQSKKRLHTSNYVGRKKRHGSSFLRDQIVEVVNSCKQFSNRSNISQEHHEQLLSDAIRELDKTPECFEDISLYLYATKLLEDRTKREIFMAMFPERRIYYLRYCYENREIM